ncbi:MAG TPA: glycosyltransferase family 2 protein [Roseiflexaceae bacterium]|nr:glycosyltransferase family 2 protein [Roseiflexaceae bacterium]
MSDQPEITVVLPLRNRRESVAARVAALCAALAGRSYEIIAVDDGSIDGTFGALREVAAATPELRAVRLRRPFGRTAALAAGFERARGSTVVTLDAEGQTDPADIPLLLAKLDEGFDIVSGRRTIPRSLPTRLGNWLISRVTRLHLHDYGCPLKAYRADVVRELRLYGDLYRLAPAIASWQGVRVAEAPVREHRVPEVGPGAGLRRVLAVLLDLITVRFLLGYTARPMQGFGRVGGALLAAGVLLASYLVVVRLGLGQDVGERPLLLLAALLGLLGAQFLALGLLAELLVRVYYEAQRKPIYAVREEIGALEEAGVTTVQ